MDQRLDGGAVSRAEQLALVGAASSAAHRGAPLHALLKHLASEVVSAIQSRTKRRCDYPCHHASTTWVQSTAKGWRSFTAYSVGWGSVA